jgi:hypothetical protein
MDFLESYALNKGLSFTKEAYLMGNAEWKIFKNPWGYIRS